MRGFCGDLWVGHAASDGARAAALDAAAAYAAAHAPVDGRSPHVPITRVLAGEEPAPFTCHFAAWSADAAASSEDAFTRRLRAAALPPRAVRIYNGIGILARCLHLLYYTSIIKAPLYKNLMSKSTAYDATLVAARG